jgi:hypothetical protein
MPKTIGGGKPNKLSDSQIQQFIEQGFVKIENAFSKEIAAECRAILWRDTGLNPDDPQTWTQSVVWLGNYTQKSFTDAANTPILRAALDQLIGENRWAPCVSVGSFPVRFPSEESAGDDGWHVEASFPGDVPEDYLQWRINVESKGRALLMLMLFSDVGERNAPTRIRLGSHLEAARILEPHGEKGLAFMELAAKLDATKNCEQILATGEAGTVYLCHPFLVHAAQAHHGTNPRFMAQPPIFPREAVRIFREDGNYSPVEKAIRLGLKAGDGAQA